MVLRYIILLIHFCNVNRWKWMTCFIGVPSVWPFSRFQRIWRYDYRCACCFVIEYDRGWVVHASGYTSPEPVHWQSNKTQIWLWGHTFVWPKIWRTFFQNSIVVMDTATYEETQFIWFNDTWIEALLCHCRENGRCWECKLQDISALLHASECLLSAYWLSMAGSWDTSVSRLTMLWAGEPGDQVVISGSGT